MPCYSTHMPYGPALEIVRVPVEPAWDSLEYGDDDACGSRGNSMGWRGRARISTISTAKHCLYRLLDYCYFQRLQDCLRRLANSNPLLRFK